MLQDHINYSSLLSVKDTLSEYGVESVAMKKGNYDCSNFETPFLCSIQKEDWPYTYLTVVTEIQGEHIWYLDPMINVATGGYCRTRDGRDGTCTYYMGIYGCVPN